MPIAPFIAGIEPLPTDRVNGVRQTGATKSDIVVYLMTFSERIVNAAIRGAARVLLRFDPAPLRDVPQRGPLIVVSNHTTNIEAPLLYVFLRPRPISGIAKRELWSNPATRFLMQIWDMIPISRGRLDSKAFERARRSLISGALLGIAPEGTRSGSGSLRRGQPGAALLALQGDAPILPVAQWGLHSFVGNVRQGRRTRVSIRVGRPFRLKRPPGRPGPAVLRQMADEIMYQIAVLLPARFRGVYRDLDAMTSEFVEPV